MSQTAPVAPLEAETEIAAPQERVWELVSDLRGMTRWSDQTWKVFARGPIRAGSSTFNLNKMGWRVWPTSTKVVAFEPGRRIAFRVNENRTIWSYELSPAASGGTRVVHRREAPKGISKVSTGLVNVAMGGVPSFTRELQAGMGRTLGRIKAEAER